MINQIQSSFYKHKNSENASSMKSYMKDHFDFLGVKAPVRKELLKHFKTELKDWDMTLIWDLILNLWGLKEREFQYLALDLLKWKYKKPKVEDLEVIQYLIRTKSWWDTVDLLASHSLGLYLKTFPEKRELVCSTFYKSNNFWLQRSSIIFQLKYKTETDIHLLYQQILTLNTNTNFFIQKAIGWSLREYSKTNPESVQNFLKDHPEITKLAHREAIKYL